MKYNVIWDTDVDNFRNVFFIWTGAGEKPMFEMKCNQCLSFIGAYTKPEDIEPNYCHKCGQKLKVE